MLSMVNRITKQDRFFIVSCFIWGMLAHGIILFHKLCFHDDQVALFWHGTTYPLGRWMLGVLGEGEAWLWGGANYSTPLINGFISLCLIASAGCMIIHLLEIREKELIICIAGVMVVMPSVTGLFGYMFTAPFYMIGMIWAVISATIMCRHQKVLWKIAAIVLLAASIGIYQAYLVLCMTIVVLDMIKKVLGQSYRWKDFFIVALRYGIDFLCALGLYLVLNKIFLYSRHMSMSSYSGLDTMGIASIRDYVRRIVLAYKEFWNPSTDRMYSMYPARLSMLYRIMLCILVILTVMTVIKLWRNSWRSALQIVLLVIVYPLVMHFIFVLTISQHALMMYAEFCIFLILFLLLSFVLERDKKADRVFYSIVVSLIMLMNFLWVRYDNICYLKATFEQQQAISYFTTLISRIKNTEGYNDDMPIIYIQEYHKKDSTFSHIWQFDIVRTNPYMDESRWINNYAWQWFMRTWCGFDPRVADASVLDSADMEQVRQLTIYPDSGSIQVIGDYLVVRFADE